MNKTMIPSDDQTLIRQMTLKYRFTFQELKQISEMAQDLKMWRETPLSSWWQGRSFSSKDQLFRELRSWISSLKSQKSYPAEGFQALRQASLKPELKETDKKIFGTCPAASEETVCCNLRTIDAVENCGFGCSYCTIQTFYGDRVTFDKDLGKKLREIPIDPNRYYHFGTGQSSDSLMWGNPYGILDDLSLFARENPNILLEFKTKSKNVSYFLKNKIPKNIVVSWSLNTPTIIKNEENFTASLEERLEAARKVADQGVKVAFHFHPIVHYDSWREDYQALIEAVLEKFDPREVLFLSMGTVTFIKPVIKALRKRGWESKMLQMPMEETAKKKWSYPAELKKELFQMVYSYLTSWQGKVYMYLCMERPEFWQSTFGHYYPTNNEFESDFGRQVFEKIG